MKFKVKMLSKQAIKPHAQIKNDIVTRKKRLIKTASQPKYEINFDSFNKKMAVINGIIADLKNRHSAVSKK